MLKEHCVALAEIIVIAFTLFVHSKALLGTAPITGKLELTRLTLRRQAAALIFAKRKLLIGPNHITHRRFSNFAQSVFGIHIMVT